jgi:hypothetical protein
MSTQPDPPERTAQGTSGAGTQLPAIARYWWLTALRGLVALALALAITVGGRNTGRLITFLALFWMTGGLITLRFALAIRPPSGVPAGVGGGDRGGRGGGAGAASRAALGGRGPRGVREAAGHLGAAHGLLRILGGFAAEERVGRRWTLGGIVLGTLELGLGALLLVTSEVDPDLLVPIGAAWGAVSGILLLAQGARAAPRSPDLAAGIGWAWHARVTYGGPEPPTSK